MNTPTKPPPSGETARAYETLREQVLVRSSRVGGDLGLSVFLRQGMVAWVRAYTQSFSTLSLRAAPTDPTRIPGPMRESIIDVMVAMATNVSRSFHPGAV